MRSLHSEVTKRKQKDKQMKNSRFHLVHLLHYILKFCVAILSMRCDIFAPVGAVMTFHQHARHIIHVICMEF